MRNKIRVSQIDLEKAGAFFTAKAKEAGQDVDVIAEPFVVVSTGKGIATVCAEGVGWWANDDGKYLISGYVGAWGEPTYYLTAEELSSLISDEMIDFSEFVRSFGDRLEVNYDLWFDQIRGCFQEPTAIRQNLAKTLTPA